MAWTTKTLTRKRDKLQVSATEASGLAQVERELADQQHLVARHLQILADDLTGQVVAVEMEMQAVADKESLSA